MERSDLLLSSNYTIGGLKQQQQTSIPEWSDYAQVLILVTVVGGFLYIRKIH